MFGLADLKSPKVKKWPKKDDRDNTDKKQVSMFHLFFKLLFLKWTTDNFITRFRSFL